jgi:outer membrane protein assembly factor BamE (lipoprotein component of BamABCDE complex)
MKYFHLVFPIIFFPLMGCVIMPIPTQEHNFCHTAWADNCDQFKTRAEITKETLQFMRAGSTSKEEVLLKLGAPDSIGQNEAVFEYEWLMVNGYTQWAIGFWPGVGAAGGLARFSHHVLSVEFDERNVVTRYEIKSLERSRAPTPAGDDQ